MKPIAIILAGGKSSRMGKDKADIPWQGQSLWQYQKQKLHHSQLFSDIWIMRNKEGFMQDDEKYKHQGPLAGICTALLKASENQKEALLFLPVDMPFIGKEALQELAQSYYKQESPPQAAFFEEEIFPLLLHISSLPILQEYLKHSRSVYGFLEQLKIHTLAKSEYYDFTNMNKPDDLPQNIPL